MAESLSWWVGLDRAALSEASRKVAERRGSNSYSSSFDPGIEADIEVRRRMRRRALCQAGLRVWRAREAA